MLGHGGIGSSRLRDARDVPYLGLHPHRPLLPPLRILLPNLAPDGLLSLQGGGDRPSEWHVVFIRRLFPDWNGGPTRVGLILTIIVSGIGILVFLCPVERHRWLRWPSPVSVPSATRTGPTTGRSVSSG